MATGTTTTTVELSPQDREALAEIQRKLDEILPLLPAPITVSFDSIPELDLDAPGPEPVGEPISSN